MQMQLRLRRARAVASLFADMTPCSLLLCNSQAFVQLLIEQSLARFVRLKPFAINDHLRHGTLTHPLQQFRFSPCILINVDDVASNSMLIQKARQSVAIPAPCGRINRHLHTFIVFRDAPEPTEIQPYSHIPCLFFSASQETRQPDMNPVRSIL